ncbi:hypothetical protein ACD591_02560 [Rufibacter glacialis]|uniref:Uncharacterized protein n=1 Tax=Rufibacter glacialis TaxID=1259555 RepID=A0A5M8QIB6_9BACT|nr:hypothetical protein [Rufibacter glacialis]KAA6435769.1 hypothetical protein FOE74_07460 [Rufibacter glacialis]GGK66360.1 hypothetical protein GCM10011405_12910 [Rufibacter glacialis]
MKCELSLVFEENDGTLRWIFNILIYAHQISDPQVRKMLQPTLKEFLHKRSYQEVIRLAETDIDEGDFVRDYLKQNLIKFNASQVRVKGEKIRSICFTIEQAGHMQAAADPASVDPEVLALFEGHELKLRQINHCAIEALKVAGAKGVQIEKFSHE